MYKDLTDEIVAYKLAKLDKIPEATQILTQYLKENNLLKLVIKAKRDLSQECQAFAKNSAFYDTVLKSGFLDEWYQPVYKPISLSKDFMKSLGFKTTKDDGQYGEAIEIRTNGMTVINWNREGHSCTYFGDKLEKNISIGIRKDGGTRTAFSGYIFRENQLKDLLELTW